MKKLFFILQAIMFTAFVSMAFISCGDDDEVETPTIFSLSGYTYRSDTVQLPDMELPNIDGTLVPGSGGLGNTGHVEGTSGTIIIKGGTLMDVLNFTTTSFAEKLHLSYEETPSNNKVQFVSNWYYEASNVERLTYTINLEQKTVTLSNGDVFNVELDDTHKLCKALVNIKSGVSKYNAKYCLWRGEDVFKTIFQ